MSTSNFKFLDDLIHRRSRRIYLNSDIVLDKDEIPDYRHGIKIDRDNIKIMGNGHTIDACSIARIFSITGKNIVIEDLNFKNGYSKCRSEDEKKDGVFGNPILPRGYGGAIYNRGELELINCSFSENRSSSFGGAIANMTNGNMKINDCSFRHNIGYCGGAIFNKAKLLIGHTWFDTNGGLVYNSGFGLYSHDKSTKYGGAILNENQLIIGNCNFYNNYARDGGAINNYFGKIRARMAIFSENASRFAGAINNYKGEIEICDSAFSNNFADRKWTRNFDIFDTSDSNSYGDKRNVSCGAIYNAGLSNLNNCRFIDNHGSPKSIINRKDCLLNVNKSFFGDGCDNEMTNEGSLKQNGCIFNFDNWKSL